MLRLSDSRNFSRTLAAIGLIVGPLLFAVSGLLDPAWDDDAATYLAEVRDGKSGYIAAGVLGTIGALLFIPGTLGVARLFRTRRVSLGQVGATLITIGLIGLTAMLAFNALDVVLAEADNRGAAAIIYDSADESAALTAYWMSFFLGGVTLGSILLVIALFRRRIVPIWSPILLLVSVLAGFFGESGVTSALSFVLLLAALFPLAMLMWNLSDEDWERWELPVERHEPAAVEAPTQPAEA
jgi:Domain of unknown function (DUF4386)